MIDLRLKFSIFGFESEGTWVIIIIYEEKNLINYRNWRNLNLKIFLYYENF